VISEVMALDLGQLSHEMCVEGAARHIPRWGTGCVDFGEPWARSGWRSKSVRTSWRQVEALGERRRHYSPQPKISRLPDEPHVPPPNEKQNTVSVG